VSTVLDMTSKPPEDGPAYIGRSELLDRAWRFAYAAHEGERSRGDTRIEHPAAVALLLLGEHAADDLVAAGLLHDVLEDTTVERDELERTFGVGIADLVAQLSEDPTIEDYRERKAHLRKQVARAGEDAALIFLADKLARVHALEVPISSLPAHKLAHYRATLELLSHEYPGLPFSDELAQKLA
jgi:(p)ppGpp synthase/HD superfamily hydrolase